MTQARLQIRKTAACLVASLLALSACEVQSGVQGRYVDQQSDCRGDAEDRMDDTPGVDDMSAKQRNTVLVDHFSTCMIKHGWHVARPIKNPQVPTPPGTSDNPKEAMLPAQPLPGQPSDVITAASPAPGQPKPASAVATPSSPPNQPVRTQPSLLQPSGGQPALSQPATGQAPASYQPATRAPAPGRNF